MNLQTWERRCFMQPWDEDCCPFAWFKMRIEEEEHLINWDVNDWSLCAKCIEKNTKYVDCVPNKLTHWWAIGPQRGPDISYNSIRWDFWVLSYQNDLITFISSLSVKVGLFQKQLFSDCLFHSKFSKRHSSFPRGIQLHSSRHLLLTSHFPNILL